MVRQATYKPNCRECLLGFRIFYYWTKYFFKFFVWQRGKKVVSQLGAIGFP